MKMRSTVRPPSAEQSFYLWLALVPLVFVLSMSLYLGNVVEPAMPSLLRSGRYQEMCNKVNLNEAQSLLVKVIYNEAKSSQILFRMLSATTSLLVGVAILLLLISIKRASHGDGARHDCDP